MQYKNVVGATFLSRPNRFVARVCIDGREETVHVKNTGRCRELLIPGCRVYLSRSDNPERKTAFDLISVEKTVGDEPVLVNIDSQVVNGVAEEYLRSGALGPLDELRREVRFGNSRFDFYFETEGRKAFLEVKGVTLERNGRALFPDAPTERGVKHLRELIECKQAGYDAYVLFVIAMKGVTSVSPNDEMHPAFGDALREASRAGVRILAVDCTVTADRIDFSRPVSVDLNSKIFWK